jgi:hypothetical protein
MGDEGGMLGLLIATVILQNKLGFARGRAMDGQDDVGLDLVSGARKGVTLTSGARSLARWRGANIPIRGPGRYWAEAEMDSGPNHFPLALFLFSLFFTFSFL